MQDVLSSVEEMKQTVTVLINVADALKSQHTDIDQETRSKIADAVLALGQSLTALSIRIETNLIGGNRNAALIQALEKSCDILNN